MTLNRSSAFALWIALLLGFANTTVSSLILSTVFATLGTVLIYIIVDFLLTKDRTFTLKLALRKYFLWRKMYIKGFLIKRRLQKETKDTKKLQEVELKKILHINSDTEYYKKWFPGPVENRDDYIRTHPLVKYVQFGEYFERMIRGEEKLMTSQSPKFYCVTSGTTGRPSRIPWIQYQIDNVTCFKALHAFNTGNQILGVRGLSRSMKLYYNARRLIEKSATGAPIGPATASELFTFGDFYTTPPAGYEILDEPSARYVHLLFGLRHRNLKKIEAVFVSVVYYAFLDLEKYWRDLVNDIEHGTLKKDLEIPAEIRDDLLKIMKPDKKRAMELETEFTKGFKNIAKRIWPNIEYIDSIATGPFSHYADILRSQFTADLLIFSWIYGASESFIGLNLWPARNPENFLLWPWKAFYEFIPLENVAELAPKTLFMDQLSIGGEYEVVLTTSTGLYRYRLGDVIRVIEFYYHCPVIEFLYRSGQLLSIKGEKISETVMLNTLKEVVDSMAGNAYDIVDFTSCGSIEIDELALDDAAEKSTNPFYTVFLEIKPTMPMDLTVDLQKKIEEKLDMRLTKNHAGYEKQRKKGAIDPLKLYLLKSDAFIRLRTFMLENSTASSAQLKLPRVLRKPELLQFIWSQRMF